MEVGLLKTVKVDAKTLRIHMKVHNTFAAALMDQQGEEIAAQEDGYVPDFMPGEYGDHLMLDIDIDTGQITNWTPPTREEIEKFINKTEE